MGCCLSSSSCSCKYASPNTVRVIHFNGHVEDFEHPITVSEVIGNLPKQYLCTAAQLLSAGTKPLNPDAPLQPGHLYFVLPFSTLQDDVSPLDMASVVKRLTARAKSHDGSRRTGPLSAVNGGLTRRGTTRSWKPILDTIREMSFTGRSDSDIQAMRVITTTVASN
ncbi:OSBP(oxysterol binding protein)-related protein 4B [Hibiscus syriacus]|uniref:OSBP(Oxysterol binding protein)-related protein 4B n=1 Tax=Hibiscus syriacus TaxID=106335 RepID=A0A6A2Y6W9_HIBSY|nr:OSBP(oxysterol binding protein)-related protein 4B [Hibiscus syriacus]